jgi:hypothetical protein
VKVKTQKGFKVKSICNLIAALVLVGCGGPQFSASEDKIGAVSGSAGEAGEDNTPSTIAGNSSGGSLNSSGSSGNVAGAQQIAGTNSAGTTTVGGANAGSSFGGNTSEAGNGGTSSVAGDSAAGAAGTGGSTGVNPCSVSMKSFACEGVTWDWSSHNDGNIDMHSPATHAWECPTITSEPPDELKSNFNGGIARQCTESTFGSPNNLWCCTS